MSGESVFKTSWNDASEVEATYARLCVSALLATLFGAAAFCVYLSVWFSFLGVIAVILGGVALWTIRKSEGTLTGTPLAYFGLCCGVVALVSIAVFWIAYQYGVRREADQFFHLWFASVQQGLEGIPQAKGFEAIYSRRSNAATAEEWWEAHYENKYAHRSIHQYVENKLVRVLMALGDEGKVSYYKTLNVVSQREHDTVASVYAVTYPTEFGVTETFFVKIIGKRVFPDQPDFKAAGWQIDSTPELYTPEEFKTTP